MARQAIDRALPGTGEWCKLIFYMQQPTGEFLTRVDSQPSAAAVPVDKGTAKLVRLLEVYQRNLDALNRGTSAIGSQDPSRLDAAAELQRKIAEIQRQLSIN